MKTTKPLMSILVIALCGAQAATIARASDVSGQWRAEFETQIGLQKYLFDFQVTEGKVAAKATAELGGQKRKVEFRDMWTATLMSPRNGRTTVSFCSTHLSLMRSL